MGGNHSYQFDQRQFYSQWERKQGTPLDGRTIWINKIQPSKQIEQYPIYADTEQAIERQRQLFSLRKDSNQLIAASHLKETVKSGLCSSAAQGRLFLERIPLKLQALQHIPFPDVLHLQFNALTGYKRLNKVVGPFRPQNEQIGFNNLGDAKVWLNSDFSASHPSSRQISEVAMVRNLLQIIQDVTDNNTTPRQNPSILNYVYRNRNDVTFEQALISIKQYANQYNNGLVPRNLECIQRIGVDTISRSLIGGKQDTFNTTNLQSQRSGFNSNITTQQPFIINPSRIQQRNSLQYQNAVQYNVPQAIQGNVPVYQTVQTVQSAQTIQPLRNINIPQPIQVTQPPVQNQNVQSNLTQVTQPIQVSQPVALGISGVRSSKVNFNPPTQIVQSSAPIEQNFIQSQVQTVRPLFFKQPQSQRVIQQIIRSPQGPTQIIPQSVSVEQVKQPIAVNENAQVNQTSQVSQVVTQNVPIQSNYQSVQRQFIYQTQPVSILPSSYDDKNNSNLQQEIQLNRQEINQNQSLSSTEVIGNDYAQRSRNFIDSNTMNIGIEKTTTQQYQSYNSSADKYGGQNNFDPASSRYKQISLQDGKSSQTLLAELKGFSSSKKDISNNYNNYEFSNNSYNNYQRSNNTPIYNNYNFSSSTEQQSNNIYSTFNKYAKGNDLEDNLEMKYSMTKNLYDQPQTTSYEFPIIQKGQASGNVFENNQYEYSQDLQNYQQDGEYQVDYDPQILADIQILKG